MKKLLISTIMVLAGITFLASMAAADTYYLHLAGNCSSNWGDTLGSWSNSTSINCQVNMNNSISQASGELEDYLDQYCTGDDWCYIMNYSAGDAVLGYTLANAAVQYNIVYAATAAGAGGGSDIAFSNTMASYFTCDLAADLDPTTVRNMYNHNDTNSATIYRIGGYDGWWYTSWLLPGEDDGIIAYHSAGASTGTGSYNNLCGFSRWTNHQIAYTCGGYNLDHYEIKTKFVDLLGGY
ncbi:MAG: hypothetical protein GY754_01550 [bacterium]|nr:hypothetical protein [bacterium]